MSAKQKPIETTKRPQTELEKENFIQAPPISKFNFYLVVRNPFLKYQKGQAIYNDDLIQAILDDGDLHHCNKVTRPSF